MRKIPVNNLPHDLHDRVVVKANERNSYKNMAAVLERTFKQCSEMRKESELNAIVLEEDAKQEGLRLGFQLFISQLISFLEDFYQSYNRCLETYQQQMKAALNDSLNDPDIVNLIVNHLKNECRDNKILRIIIPNKTRLPVGFDTSQYEFTDASHITIQNDLEAIRFPSDALCRQWLEQADFTVQYNDHLIRNLAPEFLRNIADHLITLSNDHAFQNINNKKELNNE